MVEMQFGDFITCGFNQIVNNLAKTHFRWDERIPVVLRVPVGGGVGAGPFHSQNVESWFTSVAGLKVLAPATPYDAKGLLISAFEDGNPVLYLEHKLLYRSARGPVPEGHYTLPIGRARIAREGRDATIVTYGVGVRWALNAAEAFTGDGVEIEVVDLRSLMPWDVEAVVESVRKTVTVPRAARGAPHRRIRRGGRCGGGTGRLPVARRPGLPPRSPRHPRPFCPPPRGASLPEGSAHAGAARSPRLLMAHRPRWRGRGGLAKLLTMSREEAEWL